MSEITDWEPTNDSPSWENRYSQQLQLNGRLLAEVNDLKIAARENADLVRKLQQNLKKQKADSETQLQAQKNDAIITLRAIDLCLAASLNSESKHLTHRARNFRMRHVAAIITNQIAKLTKTTYEDDF